MKFSENVAIFAIRNVSRKEEVVICKKMDLKSSFNLDVEVTNNSLFLIVFCSSILSWYGYSDELPNLFVDLAELV